VRGVVRDAWALWEMCYGLGMHHLGDGVEFPHWDLLLVHLILVKLTSP
jgi:hypothetical protein